MKFSNLSNFFRESTAKKSRLYAFLILILLAFTWLTIPANTIETAAATNPILKNGVKHKDVKQLKKDLAKLGFPVPGKGTTLYGKQTEKKVKEFQKYYNLTSDGIVGSATRNEIQAILKSPLQEGKRSVATQELKLNLSLIGYPVPGKGTTLYGKDTRAVVKKFQKDYKLIENGIADKPTLSKINELKKGKQVTLKNGVRHADVKKLKANLSKLDFQVPGNGTTLFGKDTEKKVKEFQAYYTLKVDGIAGSEVLKKIDALLKSPLQNGKRNTATKSLKKDLALIGYQVPGNGTTYYGKDTAAMVKKFQKENGLRVSGIAEEITLSKIEELKSHISKPNPTPPATDDVLKQGVRSKEVQVLKRNLAKLGFPVPGNGTTLYGKETKRKVEEFQKYYKLSVDGIAGSEVLKKIELVLKSPLQNGKRHKDTKKLKSDLAKVGYIVPGNGTTLYGKDTEKVVRKFQKDYKLKVSGIADEITLAKLDELVKSSKRKFKLFIDPGHGGKDPGSSGNGLKEKDLTLDISKRIEKYLKQYKDIEIMKSRNNDSTLALAERVKMANDWKADYFVSVHINSFKSSNANGFESFIYEGKVSAATKEKQKIIHEHIVNNITELDRGKKTADFHVLRESNMPAILFEYLFISNKNNSKKLKDAKYRDKLAKLTAEGIALAFELEKK